MHVGNLSLKYPSTSFLNPEYVTFGCHLNILITSSPSPLRRPSHTMSPCATPHCTPTRNKTTFLSGGIFSSFFVSMILSGWKYVSPIVERCVFPISTNLSGDD